MLCSQALPQPHLSRAAPAAARKPCWNLLITLPSEGLQGSAAFLQQQAELQQAEGRVGQWHLALLNWRAWTRVFHGLGFEANYSATQICLLALQERKGHFSRTQVHLNKIKLYKIMPPPPALQLVIFSLEKKISYTHLLRENTEERRKKYNLFANISWHNST